MAKRAAGVLLHPTSLPGPYGVGDLGLEADRFLEWAAAAGQRVWQILPLGPPAAHGSPYGCLSTFAGNPLLISPDLLRQDGLLDETDLASPPDFADTGVPYGAVEPYKDALLRRAWERFQEGAAPSLRQDLAIFREAPEQAAWLEDWALFCALRGRFEGRSWTEWPAELARRDPQALERASGELSEETAFHAFVQFLFHRQWRRLRGRAADRGLAILGDLPIYVAHDSAEVWAHSELFLLDDDGQPLAVAGVPPDAFTADGQLWGNPLYRWDRMAEDGYAWWAARLAAQLRLTDRVRLDHFRGFAGYWEVPAGNETAIGGCWRDGPGLPLFDALRDHLSGALPVIAEDLGVITDDVEKLRQDLDLPGMRVLQFAFGEEDSPHAPHRHEHHSAIYTGTHDNDTTAGWYETLDEESRQRLEAYLGPDRGEVHWDFIRMASASVAELAVVPVQDILGLGSWARMNTPGQATGNWRWRLRPEDLQPEPAERLRRLTRLTGRLPETSS